MGGLEEKNKETGKTPLGSKALAATMKTLLPVVKIPTNIAAETAQYCVGTLTGSVRVANAYRKGIENLRPEEADLIMRSFKKGSVGLAGLLIGFFNPNNIGGYYQPGEKRDEKDVQAGGVRIYGIDIPRWAVHNPLLETLQIGATARRVMDSRTKKTATENQGIGAGALAGAVGLIDEVPFVNEMVDLPKLLDPKKRGDYVGEYAKSLVIPQAAQFAAKNLDTDAQGAPVKRKPETLGQHLESGIPYLRANVPAADVRIDTDKGLDRKVRTGTLSAADAEEQLQNDLKAKNISPAQYRERVANLTTPEPVLAFKSIKAETDEDFEGIEHILKTAPEKDKLQLGQVLREKIDGKMKTQTNQSAAEAQKLIELFRRYFQPEESK